jgi:Family of unknown function (DUF5681)
MSDDDKDGKWPAVYTPTMPERTSAGRFPKGTSGNPSGRPRGAMAQFSRELKEAFRDHFNSNAPDEGKTKGADAIDRVWKEKPEIYIAHAIRLVPQEVHVEENRAMEQMTDDELIAIVVAARDMRKTDAD